MTTRSPETVEDNSFTLALSALGWALSGPERTDRMLALTGIEPEDLRRRVSDPQLLAAILGFVEAHEPDLIACAEAVGVKPEALVAARRELER
jgi:hypothetical protein